MKIRVAGVVNDSIVDGEGLRLVIFVQGCPHHCRGCHNPETHDFEGGTEMDTNEIVEMMKANPQIDGITLSGGEPFCQPRACGELAKQAQKMGLNVWCYTGYKYSQLRDIPYFHKFLPYINVLVDGQYNAKKRTLDLPFRGSSNQRLIDVQKSLRKCVIWRYELQ